MIDHQMSVLGEKNPKDAFEKLRVLTPSSRQV